MLLSGALMELRAVYLGGGLFYHEYSLELPVYGADKKQAEFSSVLLFF